MVKCVHCDIEVANGQFCTECGAFCSVTNTTAEEVLANGILVPGYKLTGKYTILQNLQIGRVNYYEALSSDGQKVIVKEREINGLIKKEAIYKIWKRAIKEDALSLRNESELLKTLCHDAFQKVYDYHEENLKEYSVLEYPNGEKLSQIVYERDFERNSAIDLIIQLCQAIAELHQQGYAHLDIAPDNIIVHENKVKLLMSGRSRKLGTVYGEYLTTDGYSAPELYNEKHESVDNRSDIYSIGALLYTLLTNKVLAGSSPLEVVTNVREPEIARILLNCLAVNPQSRYKTADELADKLVEYVSRAKTNFKFHAATISDVGMIRHNNEDCSLILDLTVLRESQTESSSLYVVTDGMGGEQAGEVASNKAIAEIPRAIWDSLSTDTAADFNDVVREAIERANEEIYLLSRDNPALFSMGTTLTLGLRIGKELYIGHVGDSRAYLIREGEIIRLTEDHSVIAGLVKSGIITPEEAKSHPERGKIFRFLGNSPSILVDKLTEGELILQDGDILILCTDGLVNNVADNELLAYATRSSTVYKACYDLVALANERGGDDNITVIIVKVSTPT